MKLGLSSTTKETILLKNIYSLLDKIRHQHKNNKMLISIRMMNLTTPMMTLMSQPMSKFTNQPWQSNSRTTTCKSNSPTSTTRIINRTILKASKTNQSATLQMIRLMICFLPAAIGKHSAMLTKKRKLLVFPSLMMTQLQKSASIRQNLLPNQA
jgi:hypothetical protein